MRLIDTHCHIDFSEFEQNREQVLSEACNAGITDIVVPGVVASNWPRLLNIVQSRAACQLHAALGLHPCFMEQHQPQDLIYLERLIANKAVKAVGEIGLDLFIENAELGQQLEYFTAQLKLAKKYQLPVLLHVRKAHDQALKVLRQLQLEQGGIVHAFSGSEQQAQQYVQLGFKLGIGGTITYPRATKLRKLVATIELEHLVLETDAPDMPLFQDRGKINKPVRLVEVCKELAKIRGVKPELIAQSTAVQACAMLNTGAK